MVKNNERPAGGRILGVYFSKDELEIADELAARLDMKRNALIRMAVREYRPQST